MNEPEATQVFSFMYVVFATTAALPLIIFLLIGVPNNSFLLFYFISSCLTSLFLCFLIRTSKKWAEEHYKKHKLGVVERYRMDVLIQAGVIGFLTTLPTIDISLDGKEELIYCYGTFICVPAFCTCFYYYYSKIPQNTNANVYKHRYLIAIWIFFQSFLLIARLYKTDSDVPKESKGLYKVSQAVFSVLSAVSSLDFMMAWFTNTDEFSKKENQKVVVVNGVGEIEVEEVVYENEPRIECAVCYLSYSNFQNIPRILKECGHTICENCANQLLNRYNKVYLMCPFCQMITVVNGAANLLKTNQVALDFVEDLKQY